MHTAIVIKIITLQFKHNPQKLITQSQEYPQKQTYKLMAYTHGNTCKSPETSTSLMVVREERYRSAPKDASGRIAYCKTLSVRSMSESSLCICLATIFTLRGFAMHRIVDPTVGCKEGMPRGLAE
jgi:hypothetical protein